MLSACLNCSRGRLRGCCHHRSGLTLHRDVRQGGRHVRFRTRSRAEQARIHREADNAHALGKELNGKQFVLRMKAGDGGRLYGAVTTMDLAAMLEKAGYRIDKRAITISEPVRHTGEFEPELRLHTDVHVRIKVKVEAIV